MTEVEALLAIVRDENCSVTDRLAAANILLKRAGM